MTKEPGAPAAASPAVEMVSIGDELLYGQTLDTNSAWLGRVLAAEGIRIARRTAVGDDPDAIRAAVADALDRSGAVVCSGGLGPTSDDRTKQAVADLFGREMATDPAVLDAVRERFRRRGMEMPGLSEGQALVPRGATVLPNPRGTAPGLALEDEAGVVYLLPGVPDEFRGLIRDPVLPLLRRRLQPRHPIVHRTLRTTGIPESAVAQRVADVVPALTPLDVAFYPGWEGVDVRVTSRGLDADAAEAALADAVAALKRPLGDVAYSERGEDLADVLGRRLRRRGLRMALAESCTGGLAAERMTRRAGASDYVIGGVVAYANEAKVALLGVDPATLEAHGAVSGEVAAEMAAGAARVLEADCAVSITGVAGPGGGTPDKPVGTVWIGAVAQDRSATRRLALSGDRQEIRRRSSQAALALLLLLLNEEVP